MSVQQRGAARREEILSVTIDLACERGHRAVRIADVANRLNVSAGLVIYHYRTKEELLAAAFAAEAERDLETARAIIAGEPDPVSRLLGIMEWYLPTGESSRSWRLWLDGWAASQFDDSLAEVIREFDEAWRQLFVSVMGECVASGAARIASVSGAAEQLAAYLNGLALRCLTASDRPSEEVLKGWSRQFIAGLCSIDALLPGVT